MFRAASGASKNLGLFVGQTYLPELGTNLVTALSSLDVNDFPHLFVDELATASSWMYADVPHHLHF